VSELAGQRIKAVRYMNADELEDLGVQVVRPEDRRVVIELGSGVTVLAWNGKLHTLDKAGRCVELTASQVEVEG
jgi:hypothetical protein